MVIIIHGLMNANRILIALTRLALRENCFKQEKFDWKKLFSTYLNDYNRKDVFIFMYMSRKIYKYGS